MTKLKTKNGFTLAEVLVTLVVIGVIAALTIPALIQGTNQQELKTGLKKALSTLNQAIVMSIAQDAADTTNCKDCDAGTNATALAYYFISKLNVLSQTTAAAKPYFYTSDGMKFTIDDINGVCNNTDIDPDTANCQIIVDVNGDKSPNTASTGSATFKDQYRLVVRKNSVVPASDANYTVAVNALQQ